MSRSSHLQKWLSIMPNKWSEIHFVESTQDYVDKSKLTSEIPIQFIETKYDLLSKYFIPFWLFNQIVSRFFSSLKLSISSNQATFRIAKALRDNEYDAVHCFEIQPVMRYFKFLVKIKKVLSQRYLFLAGEVIFIGLLIKKSISERYLDFYKVPTS
jgi:hypothetical protein